MSNEEKSIGQLFTDLFWSIVALVKYVFILAMLVFIAYCGYKYSMQNYGEEATLGFVVILLYLSPFVVAGIIGALVISALMKYLRK